jgi:hypothetical protein
MRSPGRVDDGGNRPLQAVEVPEAGPSGSRVIGLAVSAESELEDRKDGDGVTQPPGQTANGTEHKGCHAEREWRGQITDPNHSRDGSQRHTVLLLERPRPQCACLPTFRVG